MIEQYAELWGLCPGVSLDKYAMAPGVDLIGDDVARAMTAAVHSPAGGFTLTAGGVALIEIIGPTMRNPGPMARFFGFTSSRAASPTKFME